MIPCAGGDQGGAAAVEPRGPRPPRWGSRAFVPAVLHFQLQSLGYVASSDLPRAGEVVRLELNEFCTSVARLGWAKASGCRWDERTCELRRSGRAAGVLQWAREHGCLWNAWTCCYAAAGGHLEVLQWARAHGCPWDEMLMCSDAAEGGHLEVLKWLREVGCSWDARTCLFAARGWERAGVAECTGA